MGKYMTKQRKMLLDFFSNHADEALSAKQIESMLGGESVSVSAVYRNLAELEEDGLVKRISKAGTREVFYQFTDAPQCRDRLHLSCRKCGKTYHMNDDDAERIIRSIAENESFSVDRAETVLYGICADCNNNT